MTHKNHIDNPEEYIPWSCACCTRCWLHSLYRRCIHGGPFTGYEPVPANWRPPYGH